MAAGDEWPHLERLRQGQRGAQVMPRHLDAGRIVGVDPGQVPDFIEEKSAAVRFLEFAFFLYSSGRKRSFAMTE